MPINLALNSAPRALSRLLPAEYGGTGVVQCRAWRWARKTLTPPSPGGTLSKLRAELNAERLLAAQVQEDLDEERLRNAELEEELAGLGSRRYSKQASSSVLLRQASMTQASSRSSVGGPPAKPASRRASPAGVEAAVAEEPQPERFTVKITRDEVSGTLGVDIDVWHGHVTVAVIEPDVPAAEKLQVATSSRASAARPWSR